MFTCVRWWRHRQVRVRGVVRRRLSGARMVLGSRAAAAPSTPSERNAGVWRVTSRDVPSRLCLRRRRRASVTRCGVVLWSHGETSHSIILTPQHISRTCAIVSEPPPQHLPKFAKRWTLASCDMVGSVPNGMRSPCVSPSSLGTWHEYLQSRDDVSHKDRARSQLLRKTAKCPWRGAVLLRREEREVALRGDVAHARLEPLLRRGGARTAGGRGAIKHRPRTARAPFRPNSFCPRFHYIPSHFVPPRPARSTPRARALRSTPDARRRPTDGARACVSSGPPMTMFCGPSIRARETSACGGGGTFFHRLPTVNMTSLTGQACKNSTCHWPAGMRRRTSRSRESVVSRSPPAEVDGTGASRRHGRKSTAREEVDGTGASRRHGRKLTAREQVDGTGGSRRHGRKATAREEGDGTGVSSMTP